MKYYKHMSNMVHDVKIRRVISKYGLRGYGLYNFILEAITANIEDDRPLPVMEEASTDIADLFGEDTAKIEEMICFFISQGLVEQEDVEGKILCTKVYRYLQQSETRSQKIRALIQKYKNLYKGMPELPSQTVTDNFEEEKRIEKKRREETRHDTHPTLGVPINKTRYDNLCAYYSPTLVDDYIQRVIDWGAATGKRTKDFAARAGTWLKRDEQDGKIRRATPEDARHDFSHLRSGYGK